MDGLWRRRTVSLKYIKLSRTDDELRYYSTLSHCQESLEKLSIVYRSDRSTYLRHYIFSSYSFQAGVCGYSGNSSWDAVIKSSYACVNKVFHFRHVTKPPVIKFISEVACLCGLSSFIF